MRLALMIEGQEGVSPELARAGAGVRSARDRGALPLRSLPLRDGSHPGGARRVGAVIPALATRTDRLELGTLASPVTFRPAAVLANASATAYEISNGRITTPISRWSS